MLDLNLEKIQDDAVRDCLQKVQEEVRKNPFANGQFKFFEIKVTGGLIHTRFRHLMGFQPKDVILTYKVGPGVVTFHNELFDKEFIEFSTSGALNMRFFVGTYVEDTGA